MNRKSYILLLLFLQWPLFNLYRLFMALPGDKRRLFLFCQEEQGIQWYLRFLGDSIAYACVFMAVWLYIKANYKKDRDVITAFGAVFINQVIDIFHYIGFSRHSEWVLCIEGFVMLFAGLILVDRQLKKKHG
jgi:hypothetical protein